VVSPAPSVASYPSETTNAWNLPELAAAAGTAAITHAEQSVAMAATVIVLAERFLAVRRIIATSRTRLPVNPGRTTLLVQPGRVARRRR